MKNSQDRIRELEDRCKALENALHAVTGVSVRQKRAHVLRRQLDNNRQTLGNSASAESYDNRNDDFPDFDPDNDENDCSFGR
jgi:hypothetical protein